MKNFILLAVGLFWILSLQSQTVLSVGVAGMNHDHVNGLLHQYEQGKVKIIGISEADTALVHRYQRRFHLPDSLFFGTLQEMLSRIKPDAVLAYNAISDHLAVVETCAPRHIPVMVEKPLAVSVAAAERMASLARQYHVQVLTNFETTWYPSNQYIFQLVNSKQSIGPVRKMIVHDGHQGPKEIGCSEDFLRWLTDPVKNGGGALVDFGCYGANLMTWLMQNQKPLAVTAVTKHIKPDVYPNVDDDATILLEYPGATGIIEASWNWPFGIKDWEVFGKTGYLHALNGTSLQQRSDQRYDSLAIPAPQYTDNLSYLADVLQGTTNPGHDLSSLENNLIVVQILDAAKLSAKTGKRILLK